MNRVWTTAGALTITAGLALSTATASPMNRGWIDQDATWLVHVDVERLLASEMGRFIADQIEKAEIEEGGEADGVEVNVKIGHGDDGVEVHREVHGGGGGHSIAIEAIMPESLREFREKFGFDPMSDVLGITMFGDDAQAGHPTMIVHTTAAIDNAMKELEKVDGVEMSQLNGATVGSFTFEEGETPKFVAIRPEANGTRLMFMAESIDHLTSVLSPGGKSKGPAWAAPGAESFIYVYATKDSPFAEGAVHSQMLRDAESIELNIGQRGQSMFVDGVLEAGAAEVATNMAQVGNGLLALARLGAMQGEGMDEETKVALDLMQNLTVRADGEAVRVNVSFEVAKLMKLIEAESN